MKCLPAIIAVTALAASVAGTAPAQTMLSGPDTPGETDAGGVSALAAIFPEGLPWPFEQVVGQLGREAGAGNFETALIPLGRSSQRMAAHPDFFASPRVVVAVTGDFASGPGGIPLANRLFLAYQAASNEVLAIAWNEQAGRYEFEQVTGYDESGENRVERANREDCAACHQGEGPIFSRPLWSETPANPAVARTLEPLGGRYLGLDTAAHVDGLFQFDEATDGAMRLLLARRLWAEGCPGRVCRSVLLANALRYGLNGRRPDWQPLGRPEVTVFETHTARLWPTGLGVPSPDLPDRDPIEVLGALSPGEVTDALLAGDGLHNPATPRAAMTLWRPGEGSYAGAVRAIAESLTPGDFLWLDGRLSELVVEPQQRSLPCEREIVEYGGNRELRFDCDGAGMRLSGFLTGSASAIRGRLDSLEVSRAGSIVARPAVAVEIDGTLNVRFPGEGARLADGRRLTGIAVGRTRRGASVETALVDDMAPFANGLDRLAAGDHPLFEADGLTRENVLDAIERALNMASGAEDG